MSDFQRFHGVQDIREMDGPRFFRLAWRISAYGGVMTARLRALHLEAQQTVQQFQPGPMYRPAPAAPMPARVAVTPGARVQPLSAFLAEQGGSGGEVVRIKKKAEVA